MPKIRVLPKQIAELIAAGEVVERPASVVKELLENAIDAGATSVTAEIKNGGISYIRVTDNGCGIARDDIRSAFLSHGTSKISAADDLNAIMTLGFRGEALPSISAVARVEVLTRTPEDAVGTRYVIESGEEVLLDDAGCPAGTTVIVRDIFYKTPARMKFLKKDVTEANAVAGVLDRLALSHPEVSFRFIREGKQTLLTSGRGDLLQCVREVFGKAFAADLIPASYTGSGIAVTGYISRPAASRPNRNMQFFFLNNRLIRTGTGSAALTEGYKNAVMAGKFPACVLHLTVDPAQVDVNVHPAKTEVRFSDERAVFNAVYYACKNALAEGDSPKQMHTVGKAEAISAPPPAPAQQLHMQPARQKTFWQHIPAGSLPAAQKSDPPPVRVTPAAAQQSAHLGALHAPATQAPPSEVQTDEELLLHAQPMRQTPPAPAPEDIEITDAPATGFDESAFRLVGEAFQTYILCEYRGKLVIIDKHAAHERIIYERLKAESGARSAQALLAPVTVTLTKEDYAAMLEQLPLLTQAGFEVEDFGNGALIVQACPMELSPDDVPEVIAEIAGRFAEKKQDVSFEKLDWIFHSVSCRSAIKAGNFTSRYEMERFAKQLLSMPEIRYCPHGRPVLIEMTQRELEKNFGRV
ncbi:MAG: DNA mismatch repair endonuclease MutL [Clostridia bacterium]|nr:DNA mismatch repair endonuclease MutL [Clostridia bacterium]